MKFLEERLEQLCFRELNPVEGPDADAQGRRGRGRSSRSQLEGWPWEGRPEDDGEATRSGRLASGIPRHGGVHTALLRAGLRQHVCGQVHHPRGLGGPWRFPSRQIFFFVFFCCCLFAINH